MIALIVSLLLAVDSLSHHYGAETLKSVQRTGLVKLSGTKIEEQLQLNGSLISQNAEIGSLNIMGEANLTGTTIKESSTVMGSLQATRSTFTKALTLLSQKSLFTSSTLDTITILKDNGFKGKQIIELRQGTIVNGAIHFESGKGEVILSPGCQVLGTVTGGKIVRK